MIELLESQVNQFYANREFPAALELLDRLVALQPKTPRWREFRAAVRVDNKSFPLALEDYTAALELLDAEGLGRLSDGDRARLLSGRALVFEGLSEWEKALDDYNAASTLALEAGYSDDPYLINARGNVLGSLGRWSEAREQYLTSANIFQSSKGYRGRNGSTTQRLDGAIYASSNAALALAQMGDEDGALKEFERISRRAPGSVDARAALAALLYSKGRQQEAEDVFGFACENIKVGCTNYRDSDWLLVVRRWPPVMVERMKAFISLGPVARAPAP